MSTLEAYQAKVSALLNAVARAQIWGLFDENKVDCLGVSDVKHEVREALLAATLED